MSTGNTEKEKLKDNICIWGDDNKMGPFISTLLHEIKTPVREIDLYAEFIGEDNEDVLKQQSVQDLQAIHELCEKVRNLIEHLMEYAKVDFKELEKKKIDVSLLVKQCFDEQVRYTGNRKAVLEIGSLPPLFGDPLLIRLVFQNLISNSVKFSGHNARPKIVVKASVNAEGVTYGIRDNGVGFDQTYAAQLFEPFSRLQNEGAFEGSGIGLTIVHHIIRKLDGWIQIEGKLNRGCFVELFFPSPMLYQEGSIDSRKHDTVRIGIVSDFTGRCPLNEQGKRAAYLLAAEEINAAGGINGMPVELLFRDDHGDTRQTAQAAKELTEDKHVDVLMGSTLSPSRDILRKYANEMKVLYIDTQQTEGGVADHYTFCLSAMPEQQMQRLIGYLIPKYGRKVYILTSDYNFGILSAEWAKFFVRQASGEVVGCEYLDDKITNFHPIIDRIVQVTADILVSICVFSSHQKFYEQWHSRGMNHIPNASTMALAETYDQLELSPPVMENTYVMASFLEDLDTTAAKEYVRKFRAKFDRSMVPYMGMDTETAYSSMYLYKKAVEMAGTRETEAVIDALESNTIYFDGPGGRVTVRGADHHSSRRMSCFFLDNAHHIQEIFRTGSIHSDYVENMIENEYGVKGGLRSLGANAVPIQYNMLLNKLLIKDNW